MARSLEREEGTTLFGFKWGPMTVTRIASDDKFGRVLEISTKHDVMQIRVTPGGKIKVESHEKA